MWRGPKCADAGAPPPAAVNWRRVPPSADTIRAIASDLGFDLVRFGPADPGEHGDRFLAWLEAGRHGEMDYLASNTERTLHPERWRAGVRSAITLAVDYGGPAGELPGGGRVARYAVGRDYHRWLRERVFTLRQRLEAAGFTNEECARFECPMGLDIGAITPMEIAISTLARLIAIRRKHLSSS